MLSKYHLENFFLDEATLAKVFENLEPADSWLRSPAAIRQELRTLSEGLVSYAVALSVSREFRLSVGNVDLMPKACHGKAEGEIVALLVETAKAERGRVSQTLEGTQVAASAEKHIRELTAYLSADDPKWKDLIPGKPLLAKFASKANIDLPRLKTAYVHAAEKAEPNPFAEIHSVFERFANR